jgi:glycosyltransferase involved in cell wall biosynthesis
MKILIVSHYLIPHIGGIEIVAYNQAKSLIKQGHEVTIITSKIHNEAETQVMDGIQIRRVKILNIFEDKFNIPYPIFSFRLIPLLFQEIKNADLCHVHDIFYLSSISAALVSKIMRKPIILTQHVGIVYTNKFIIFVQKVVYATIGRYIFNVSRKIITYNPYVSSFIKKFDINKSKVILMNNGVDLSLFKPASDKTKKDLRNKYNILVNKKVVLFVGRFVTKKGFEKLYSAQDDNYLIIFIGSGALPKYMKNNNNVLFVKGANQKILADYYKLSDIFVLPSIGEIFTLVMQEAMASGLPIITTKEKGYKFYNIDERYIMFIEHTTKDLKQVIFGIINNKKLLLKMGEYSHKYAQREFNWDSNVFKILQIYKEALK